MPPLRGSKAFVFFFYQDFAPLPVADRYGAEHNVKFKIKNSKFVSPYFNFKFLI
jgi:hypothetical protein